MLSRRWKISMWEILRTWLDKANWTQCWWQDDFQKSLPVNVSVVGLITRAYILVTYTATFLGWKLLFVDFFLPMTLSPHDGMQRARGERREQPGFLESTRDSACSSDSPYISSYPVADPYYHHRSASTAAHLLPWGIPHNTHAFWQQAKSQTTFQLPR